MTLPPIVVLIEQPRPGYPADILSRFWQALFHARIHCVLESLTEAEVRDRIQSLGAAEIAEARSVLRQEHYLLAEDDRSVYIELAAVYLELHFFNPALLPIYFPGLAPERTWPSWPKTSMPDALLAATRPAGPAICRSGPIAPRKRIDTDESPEDQPPRPSPAAPGHYRQLMQQADRAAERGNLVRAAVLRTRAAAATTAGYAARATPPHGPTSIGWPAGFSGRWS